jgi:hypothetical protein
MTYVFLCIDNCLDSQRPQKIRFRVRLCPFKGYSESWPELSLDYNSIWTELDRLDVKVQYLPQSYFVIF